MRRFLLAFGLSFGVCTAVSAQAEGEIPYGEYVISEVNVQGAEFTKEENVLLIAGLEVGDKVTYPGDELADAVRNLWRAKLFEDAQIIPSEVTPPDGLKPGKWVLTVKVVERPRISRYTFAGIKKSQADDLREQINFTRGQRFTEARKRFAQRVIKNYYQEKGFYNVQSNVTTEPDPENPKGILITLNVNRGPRVKLKEIVISGNKEIPDKKLKKALKETREKKWWRIWKRSKYVPSLYAGEKGGIQEVLRSQGYRDGSILSDSVVVVDKKNLALHIQLFEGKQYFIRNINWEGNFKYRDGQLDTLLGFKKGDIYNQPKLETRLNLDPNGQDIASLYLDDGYLFFDIRTVETRVVGDSIDLEFRIREGTQATYNRIIIEGNTKTSDHVILRVIRTLPGNKFSRSEIIRSQREVIALGFFDQEKLQVLPIPNPADGTVDIKYIVEEKPSDQLFLQGGWGGRVRDINGNVIGGGLVATVGLQFNNFSTRKFFDKGAWRPLPSGDGQKVGIQIQLSGPTYQQYRLSFTEPWLGGRRPTSLGFSVYYQRQNSRTTDFLLNIIGASVDVGRRMKWPDDFFQSYTTLNYRHYRLRDTEQSIFAGISSGNINIISVTQAFERNSLNAPIYPTEGSRLFFSVELTPPWNLFRRDKLTAEDPAEERFRLLEFHKWKFQVESYLKVFKNFVIMPRAQFGFLGLYDRNLGLSPFERFYIGGDGLFGFALDGREIFALRGYQDTRFVGDGTNGNAIYSKFTVEFRQPLTLSPSATVWLHAFLEAGNAWTSFKEFNPFELRRSVGCGVRIFLPIFGLLGVDYGYGIDDTPVGFGGSQFHFMIGQQF